MTNVVSTNHPLISIAMAAAELADAFENLIESEGIPEMTTEEREKCAELCQRAGSFDNWAGELNPDPR